MAFENRYSLVERALHRFAFATAELQTEFSDLEDRLFGAGMAEAEIRKPVFITALPRAGTTLLLEFCAGLDDFATHCYRDMPFVLLPLMWSRFSSVFRRHDAPIERAHGDGMLVSADSAEAFEEMVWKTLWTEPYLGDRILPWGSFENPEFKSYLTKHIRKIVKLRQRAGDRLPRYLSKNNLNIARLDWLARIFPDATFVIPIRDPVQHAASLRRQHRLFLDIHARDDFARRYMEGIGHFDFGANFRPVNFGNWLSRAGHRDPATIGFWLEYWLATHEYLLGQVSDRRYFVPYEALCADPAKGLERLADILEIDNRQALMDRRDDLRPPRRHAVDLSDIEPGLLADVGDTHRRLLERAAL